MIARFAWAVLLLLAAGLPASAETITMARQYGLAFLPFLLMEDGKLIEKHAQALGVHDLTVEWTVLSGAAPMNDGLLSGKLAFGSGAPPALLLLWDKTRTQSNQVRGVSAVATMPTTLLTRNPAVHAITDFTDADRIAIPSAKLSVAALVLEMAAAKLWGPDNYAKLDRLTISMSHPDAVLQMMGTGQVDSHFASPPFEHIDRRNPSVHDVLSSLDVMGDASLTFIWTTTRYAAEHPLVVQAMAAAVAEATATINADKPAAADAYLRLSGDKLDRATVLEILNDPHIVFGTRPLGTMIFASFMHQIGLLKTLPATWQDVFLPLAHGLQGS